MLPPVPVSILGGALAIFLGFRNSSAYDRWWEARKIWGAIVNDSRSFTMETIAFPRGKSEAENQEIEAWRKEAVYRHIAWLYALNAHLRKQNISIEQYISESELKEVMSKNNVPAQLISIQSKHIRKGFEKGWLDSYHFNSLIEMLTRFYDDQGKAERIKNTVFPYYYNYFTLFFLWLFTLCLPFSLATLMDNWIMIPVSIAISFAFYILHKSGRMTENPFENLAADTPLNTICRGIEIDILQMIDEKVIPESEKPSLAKFGVIYQK